MRTCPHITLRIATPLATSTYFNRTAIILSITIKSNYIPHPSSLQFYSRTSAQSASCVPKGSCSQRWGTRNPAMPSFEGNAYITSYKDAGNL